MQNTTRRDVFQALADPTRREIMTLVAGKTLTPNGVADQFSVSRQAISKHLQILAACGVIVIRQQGRERFCQIQPQALSAVEDWMADFRKAWDNRFDKLDQLLVKMKAETKSKNKPRS